MTKKFILFVLLFVMTIGSLCYADGTRKPDPGGVNTGNTTDIAAAKPGEPIISEVSAAVGHNKVAINMMWVLFTGFLVMFMQAGLAMVETGLTRAKNVVHTIAMNFLIYPLGMLGFYMTGFALMFGGVGALGTLG
jgi:ammonium transporter, Amt family